MLKRTVTAILFSVLSTSAMADYPDKPIEIIVGYSAGGGTDVLARTLAKHLQQELGDDASIVIKNQPGAGGQIGFTSVAAAKPDGYTLGTFNLPAALALTYDRHAAYNTESFDYLANVVHDPNTIVVSQDSPYKTLDELLQAARENSSGLSVGLSSLGGNDHFSALLMEDAADVHFNLIPFEGASMARTALLGGHVAAGTMALSQTIGFEDELRVLAVLDDKRSSLARNIPTAKEQGYDVEMGSYRGFVAPADLPTDIKSKLMTAFSRLSENPDFRQELAKQGNLPDITTGDEYQQLATEQSDIAKALWESHAWK
uniref:tripartite tricarboxylate transporter substrate binding protein n=1 Tax=Halomonas sp. TaxID=1486246 RepID=UPI002613151F|nr:tripartite tricarboxylate transporter substrate binding protein [Halomonas sp.]